VPVKRQVVLLLVAIQFLTRLPTPTLTGFQSDWLAKSARYFPLVGALVGSLAVGVWWIASRVFPPAVAVGLAMLASLILTGAFHEDGFADACDGFGGGTTRDSVLAIMKDSRIGAYGAIGMVMILGLKWTTLVWLPAVAFAGVTVASHVVSRWCATALIWRLTYVREDASGKSRLLADSLSGADWLLSGVLGAIIVLVGISLNPDAVPVPWTPVLLCGLAAAAAATILCGCYFKFRIGGYTGDCLGATQQIAELIFLLTSLAMLRDLRTG
jgi:adenosylcobinamide-GDP ribazoletransferase